MKHGLLLIMFAAAGMAQAAEPQAAADPHKLICKRQSVTGSLVQSTRVCHTAAEWELLAEQNREEGRRVQEQAFRQGTH